MTESQQQQSDSTKTKRLVKNQIPYALVVARRLRKQAEAMLMEAEALESHYGHDFRPMRDTVFRHSKKFKSEMMIKDKK